MIPGEGSPRTALSNRNSERQSIEAVLETRCCNNSSNIKRFCLPVSAFHTVIGISFFCKLSWLFLFKIPPRSSLLQPYLPICSAQQHHFRTIQRNFSSFPFSGNELPRFCHAQGGSLSCWDHSLAASHPNCTAGSWAEANQSLHHGPLSPLSSHHHRIALPLGVGEKCSHTGP